MGANTYTIIAALILVLPQFIAIWQNRRIETKVEKVEDKVHEVTKSVNGVLEARIVAEKAASEEQGKAAGIESERTRENK